MARRRCGRRPRADRRLNRHRTEHRAREPRSPMICHRSSIIVACAFLCATSATAQQNATGSTVPRLASLVNVTGSELVPVVERFSADLASLNRRYDADDSPAQRTRMRAFYEEWRAQLNDVD